MQTEGLQASGAGAPMRPTLDEARETRRRRVCLWLAFAVAVIYIGFAVLVGFAKGLLGERIGQTFTVGLYIGGFVAVVPWLLTVFYVVWSNRNDR